MVSSSPARWKYASVSAYYVCTVIAFAFEEIDILLLLLNTVFPHFSDTDFNVMFSLINVIWEHLVIRSPFYCVSTFVSVIVIFVYMYTVGALFRAAVSAFLSLAVLFTTT